VSKTVKEYHGFEQGPIRPPSEAFSLFIRITRNCPWNRCTFCPVYKHRRFSIRPVEHVIRDIDAVHTCITALQNAMSNDNSSAMDQSHIDEAAEKIDAPEFQAFPAAVNWMAAGMRSIFLQDANSLVIKPAQLVEILSHLKKRFPQVKRITSYARSHSIARIGDEEIKAIADAGLNRVHIGLESGSDRVLERVQKGVTKEIHIAAGLKVKQAGMELSEYVMPGLGGKELSETHALETAGALNQINPDFIRLRTLALPDGLELYGDMEKGSFSKNTELGTVKEILLMLEHLENITSTVKSDHVLNLFQEIEGSLPEDKEHMTGILKTFLELEPQEQCLVQVGSRIGVFNVLDDRFNPVKRERVEQVSRQLNVTPENVDDIIAELMKRFV
jgi:biotin synthase-like enzyme